MRFSGFLHKAGCVIIGYSAYLSVANAQIIECVVKETNGKGYINYPVGHVLKIQRSSFIESRDGLRLTYEKERNDSLVVSRETGEFTWVIGDQQGRFSPTPAVMTGSCTLKAETRIF